jgi:nitroreductase
MGFDSILKKRHCVRHFKPLKPVKWKHVAEILDSARYAPCAGGIFTVKMIVVDDKKLFPKIADACLGQAFIAQAKYILVVCSDMEQVRRSYGKHADNYSKQQAGAAIENMFLKATELGLSTCWIGAFDENPIKRILNIPENVNVEAVLPIGYESGKEKEREKIDLKRITRFNGWKEKEKEFWPEPTATSNE